jgi:hypothetical protein
MTVDFAAMKKRAKGNKDEGMLACILGAGQAGKSTLLGTTGLPTLILHTSDESHGLMSAGIYNNDVTGVCINTDDDGNAVEAEVAFQKLLTILSDPSLIKHFGAVCLDSLSSVDILLKQTEFFKAFCREKGGVHNRFKEGEAILTALQMIVNATALYRKNGGNFLVTLAVDVKAVDGDGVAETIVPVLSTYGVANAVPRLFDTVLYTSQAVVDGAQKRALIFSTQATRVSKEAGGATKKTLNFSPCLRGISDEDTPDFMPADLSKLIAFMKEVRK